jgi:hypothetical protein
LADVKNNDNKSVSLKADETITPVKNTTVVAEEAVGPTVVSTRVIETAEGLVTEIEYSDGSIEVVPQEIK